MKKKIIIAFLIVLAAGAAFGYYQWNKPKRTANDEKPAATLTAEDLYIQYSTDEKASDAAYLNKVIQVSGTVVNIDRSENGDIDIYLETSDALGTVSCTLIPGSESMASIGDQVTVKGICTGILTDVVLTQCALVR